MLTVGPNLGGGVGKLIYSMIQSLDGYVADESGGFGWAEPDRAVHTFINQLERSIGTYLYGRRMYEVMAVWEDMSAFGPLPDYIREYQTIWRAASKVVYSTTLDETSTEHTHLERVFEPAEIRRMKDECAGDISIAGPTLAAGAIRAGLVDEIGLFVAPAIVGGGLPTLPEGVEVDLALLEERRFENGMVYLHYSVGEKATR